MASLLPAFPQRVRVLDPGAGVGTLSAAVCELILRLRSPRRVDFVLFETDPNIIPLLDQNMRDCSGVLRAAGHTMSYAIHEADFILGNSQSFVQPTLFHTESSSDPFDAVIMNPPYFKIGGRSEYARAMEHVVHGQPNIYALFMALAAELLRPGGHLVAITPRSFANGPYFRGFRRWFLQRMPLRRIHLFESRKDTFRDSDVLQESMITLSQRLPAPPSSVAISTSFGRILPATVTPLDAPTDTVIDNACGDMVVRIPKTPEDLHVIELVDAWSSRFVDCGLRVSTGPVVMFRAKSHLLVSLEGRDSVPLICVHNVRPFETVWPVTKNGKPTAFRVSSRSQQLVVPAGNYVLLRRFSAKEERRRLVASCLLRRRFTQPHVALENHINYVYHHKRELTEDEAFGLAALFNSALLDQYFRTISGSTQVNAAELRTMPLPELDVVSRIGMRVRSLPNPADGGAEEVVMSELGVSDALARYLTEPAL